MDLLKTKELLTTAIDLVGGDRHNSSGGGDADRNKLLLNVYRNCLLTNISYFIKEIWE